MKKRILSLVTALLLAVSFCVGCGNTASQTAAPAATQAAETKAAAAESVAAAVETEAAKEAAANQETIRLAFVAPLTGDKAQYGLQFQRGIEQAVLEYNAKGGAQLEVDVYDDKNDVKESASIANLILADGGYAAIIGPFSTTCAFAMAEILDEEKVVTISPSVSHVDYTGDNYYYTFRLSHINSYEGEVAAQYSKETFGATKIAGIYSENDWGLAVDEAYVNKAKEIGLDVVVNDPFLDGQTKDFSTTLTKIKDAGAEAVYYMGQYTECGLLLNQIKDMGLDINVIITTSSYKVESLELAGDAAQDVIFMSVFIDDGKDPLVNEFKKKIQDRCGKDVNMDNFIVRAYDCVNWFTSAYELCGSTDPDALRDALCETGEAGFTGVSGYCKLDKDRNVMRTLIMNKWNGKSGDETGFERITE